MMPAVTRSKTQSKNQRMGSLQPEASLSSVGQSSPGPVRKLVTPPSRSDVEQENDTTSADTSREKQRMDTSQSEASAGNSGQTSPGLKRRLLGRESSSKNTDHEEQRHKNEGANLTMSSKESLHVEGRRSRNKEISQDPKISKESAINRQQENVNILNWMPLVAVAVLFIVVMYIMYAPTGKVPSLADNQTEFERNMKEVKQDFQMQEQNLWDVVEATVGSHLNRGASNPTQPIVLLLGSHPESSDTTLCLAKRLEKILSTALNERVPDVTMIDGRDYQKKNADDAKLEVDERLQASFENGEKVAIILNLDDLPPCSILLFHSYCENENARYVDVALIFTVTLNKDQLQKKASPSKPLSLKSNVAFQISEHLTKMWVDKCSKLPEEKVEAMLSRIANNVGIVNPEKSPSC